MIIREETLKDYSEVYEMVKESFATTSHSDGDEQDYLNSLRQKETFVPELSLVAEESIIIGQIVLYEFVMKEQNGKENIFLNLSPVSVRKECLGKGIGSKLIDTGLQKAKNLGYTAVFLCGDPNYYNRFGFKPSYSFGIFHRSDKSAEWCMAKELIPNSLLGINGVIDIL